MIGATGLIGSAISRALVDAGWDVTATARSQASADWAADALDGARIALAPDLLDQGAVDAVVGDAKPDVVISCAGVMSAAGPGGVKAMIDGNVVTTALVLEASVRGGARRAFVFGSGFEYEPSSGPIAEDGPVGPTTTYGAAKVAATAIATQIRESTDLDVCVVRPFSVYGPREHLRRFVPDVITAALSDRPIEMSSGMQVRDYLFSGDLADGVARAAAYPGTLPPSLNLSGGARHDLLEMARIVIDSTGTSAPLCPGARPANPADRPVFLGDSSAAARLLDWSPTTDLRTGLERTIAWYAGHRSLREGHS